MPDIHEVIEQNNAATDFVVGTPGPIDNTTAELILRSNAVAADRLTPRQITELGRPAIDALIDAATAAKEVAPLADEDMLKLSHETDAEYSHRVQIWQPLHQLQSLVSSGEYGESPQAIAKVKTAIWLGSAAFEKVLSDPLAQQPNELSRTINYFSGNTRAAADRASRLKSS